MKNQKELLKLCLQYWIMHIHIQQQLYHIPHSIVPNQNIKETLDLSLKK